MGLNSEQNKGIYRSVLLGYLVLLLHVLLILGLGLAVVLIKGIYDFRWVIFIGGLLVLGSSAYFVFLRLQDIKQGLRDAMNDPALRDRNLEISLFGGMASFRLGQTGDQAKLIETNASATVPQIEAPRDHVKQLTELARLLEEDLISREEFERLKQELLIDKLSPKSSNSE
jgi:hypothetical protein